MERRLLVIVGTLVIAIACASLAPTWSHTDSTSAQDVSSESVGAAEAGDVTEGSRQFQTWCSGCHGPGGTGPDIFAPGGPGANVTFESLFALIRDGEGHSVPPGTYTPTELSDGNLRDLAAYIGSEAAAASIASTSSATGSVSVDDSQSNTAATGRIVDASGWPTVVVALKNDHTFWLKVAVWNTINDVAILEDDPRTNTWARLKYIPPGAEAVYALNFDPARDSTIQFFVNAGRTEDGSLSAGVVTTLQRTIDTILTAVGASARFQDASLQTMLDSIDQFTELTGCVDAVEGVLRRSVFDVAAFSTGFVGCLTDEKQAAVLAGIVSQFGVAVTTDTLRNVVFTPLKLVDLSFQVGDTLLAIANGSWAGSVVFNGTLTEAPLAPNTPSDPLEAAVMPMVRGNPAQTGRMPGPGPVGDPQLLWSFRTNGEIRTTPIVGEGKVYVLSDDGNLYAIDSQTGWEVWRFRVAPRRSPGSVLPASPAFERGLVFAASQDGILYALDAATGVPRWSFETEPGQDGSPVVADGVVYFKGDRDVLFAIDAETGEERWRTLLPDGSGGSTSVAIADGTIYANLPGVLAAYDASNGAELWRYETNQYAFAGPAVDGYIVYAGTAQTQDNPDHRLVHAVEIVNQKPVWQVQVEAGFEVHSLVVGDGLVFVSMGGPVFALDSATGALQWSFHVSTWGYQAPALVDDILYVGGGDGEGGGAIYALEATSGRELWRFTIGQMLAAPAVLGGVVYIGSSDGTLYAIGGSSPAPESGSSVDPPTEAVPPPDTISPTIPQLPLPEPTAPTIPIGSEPRAVAEGFLQAAMAWDFDAAVSFFPPDKQPAAWYRIFGWDELFPDYDNDDLSGCTGVGYEVVERVDEYSATITFLFDTDCAMAQLSAREAADYKFAYNLSNRDVPEALPTNEVIVYLENSTGHWYVEFCQTEAHF